MIFSEDINKSIEIIEKGKVFLYPTDTIWGLGCDANNKNAVSKIYEIKNRIFSKSMIILVQNIEMISRIVKKIPSKAIELIEKTENPLTIIYPNAKNMAKNVIAEDGTIAIRIPKDDFCQQLLKEYGKPIVSTSANVSGENPPANFSEISDYIKNNSDYIVKWRQNDNQKSKASTIVKITENEEIIVLRK